MLFGCSKKAKEVTLDDIKGREPRYEGLKGISYYHGGGMEGSTHRVELKKEEDGRITLTYQDADDPGICDRYRIYEVKNEAVLDELDDMVKEYNLSLWDEFPESEFEVLDAPGTSLTLYFAPQDGNRYDCSVLIDYDKEMPRDCFDVLHSFMARVHEERKVESLVETYLEDRDGNRIYTGWDIANSEEEIDELLRGYWRDEASDVMLYCYEEETMLLNFNGVERRYYQPLETVHEPLDENRCSWYRTYVNKEDEEDKIFLTMDLCRLYIEDATGLSIFLEQY